MSKKEIRLKIHEESDLFSRFDPDQKMLSEEVIAYVAHNYLNQHRWLKDSFTIRIISDVPVNQEKVKCRIQDYFVQEKENTDYLLKKLTLKEICLGVFGAVVLAIWLMLSQDSSNVNLEILSIIGWVTVWEATYLAIIERPDIHRAAKAFDRAVAAEYIFENS